MDVLRLGEYNNSNPSYLPDMIVEGFTSKIWTERYLIPGEFEFRTPYISEMLEILPLQTFVSHRKTREVMQVETHEITENEDGNDELVLRGRSVDAILESRYVEGSYNKRRKMNRQYTPLGAAIVMVWNVIANDQTVDDAPYDVTRIRKDGGPDDDDEGEGPRWPWNSKDMLPNVSVSDSATTASGDSRRWWLKEGMMYPQLTRVMMQGDLGIRTLRPPSAVTPDQGVADNYIGERCWVRTTPIDDFGTIERQDIHNYADLRFDFYRGLDRTQGNGANPAVIFNARRNHFRSASYLYSVQEWKNALEVRSGLNRKWDIYRAGQSGFTGWQRRVFDMDAGSPDIPDRPDEPKRKNFDSDAAFNTAHNKWEDKDDKWVARRARIIDEFEEDYKKDGRKELLATRKISLFSGEVSDDANALYQYKNHYWLGDTVTLKGWQAALEKAVVSEYVLTEDDTGEYGYPGLDVVEE